MPYKNKEDRKSPKNPAVGSKEHEKRMERQRARRAMDKKFGKTYRKGKDVGHKKALKNGGANKDGVRLEDVSTNRSRNFKDGKKK